MRNIYILLLFNIQIFSQIEKIDYDKQIIFIGEYHFYTENSNIEIEIIKNVINESSFMKKYILIETSPELEYFINLRDNSKLIEYLKFNTDRYFSNKKLTKLNELKLLLYLDILAIIENNNNVSVKCYDTHKSVRSVYYTLKKILENNKQCSLNSRFSDKIDSFILKNDLSKKDTLVLSEIKFIFNQNSEKIKKDVNESDFYYLEKIINTPFNHNGINDKRENYMFNQISKYINKDKQVISIGGNYHIQKSVENNLREKIEKKYNNFIKKNTLFIGIIVNGMINEKEFDLHINNSNGINIFK